MDMLVKILSIIGILTATGLLAWLLNRFFHRQELRRRGRLNDVEHFDAVDVGEHFVPTVDAGRQRAKSLVSRRFTVQRRTLVLTLLIIGTLGASLPFLGQVPATVFSILAAVLSVVIGIAAKPFLENFISGIVISLSDCFHVGDTVYIDEQLGTIEDITITHTVIKVWNWQRYVMPNSKMLNTPIHNCSNRESCIWTHIEFRTSYEEDLDHLGHSISEILQQSEHLADETSASLWPMDLEAGSVRYWLAGWANGPEEAWYLRNDMRRAVIATLQKHGIHSHSFQLHVDTPHNTDSQDATNKMQHTHSQTAQAAT